MASYKWGCKWGNSTFDLTSSTCNPTSTYNYHEPPSSLGDPKISGVGTVGIVRELVLDASWRHQHASRQCHSTETHGLRVEFSLRLYGKARL